MLDKNIQQVAEWLKDTFDNALKLKNENPARFNRILGWVQAESEGFTLKAQIDNAKSKANQNGNQVARQSIGQK